MKVLGLLTVVALFGLANGYTLKILDQNGESVSSIVEQVCWHKSGSSKQISKISTVTEIADHLSLLPEDDKLAACAKLYLNSVKDLVSLLATSNDNVCSDEKISAIQRFHQTYILKGSQQNGKAPKILVTFFYHYARAVSDICASESANLLKLVNATPEKDAEQVDKMFADVTGKTGVSSSANLHYNDIFLLWSIVDKLPLKKSQKIENYLFDGEKRVVMAAKNPEGFAKMQDFCRTKAKPMYSNSLLSTIKLIDLGYYPANTLVLDELNSINKQARRLYELTKICELLLPVRVVERATESDSDISMLSRDEVASMGLGEAPHEPEVAGEPCKKCSFPDVDTLPTATMELATPVAREVRANINGRKGAVSRLIKIFFTNAKSNISDKLKKMFASETPEEMEKLDESQLELYDVSEAYEEEEDDDEKSLERSKRNLGYVLRQVGLKIVQIIWYLFYVLWFLITVFVFQPLYFIFSVFSWFTGLDCDGIRYFLSTGMLGEMENLLDHISS